MFNSLLDRKRIREVGPCEVIREQTPSKRQAQSQQLIDLGGDHHDTLSRREIVVCEIIDTEDNPEQRPAERRPLASVTIDLTLGREIYDGHPEIRGSGLKYDPYTLVEWTGDGVIAAINRGAHFDLTSDDEEEQNTIQRPVSFSRSPSPLIFHQCPSLDNPLSPAREVHFHDNPRMSARSAPGTLSHVPAFEKDEEEDNNDEDDIVTLDEDGIDDNEYIYSQDWTTFKQEPADDVPTFPLSPKRTVTCGLPTPASSQNSGTNELGRGSDQSSPISGKASAHTLGNDEATPKKARKGSLRERVPLTEEQKLILRKLLIKKKKAFYDTFGPSEVSFLKRKIAKWLQDNPQTKGEDECWLYTGPITKGQRTLSVPFYFSEEQYPGTKYNLSVNVAFVAMLVYGYMTEDFKKGIIEHSWHASHMCGNWTCTNPRHIIAEPGSINSTRNPCFHGTKPVCPHIPACKTHLRKEPQPGTSLWFQARVPEEPQQSSIGDEDKEV
jgi:hypothetical protein